MNNNMGEVKSSPEDRLNAVDYAISEGEVRIALSLAQKEGRELTTDELTQAFEAAKNANYLHGMVEGAVALDNPGLAETTLKLCIAAGESDMAVKLVEFLEREFTEKELNEFILTGAKRGREGTVKWAVDIWKKNHAEGSQ